METNWKGLLPAVTGQDWILPKFLRLIQKSGGSDNRGVPFCLTEDFAAVYRLHPLLLPGLIIESEGTEPNRFVTLTDCLTAKGRDLNARTWNVQENHAFRFSLSLWKFSWIELSRRYA